jgi:PTS system nitrogen regulatory IIA component
LARAIDFESIDGKPVDIVFVLLLPTSAQGEQLNALASVARKLRDAAVLRKMRDAREVTALYDTLVR